jgi:hypothetical protein
MKSHIFISKANGEKELFDVSKLRSSLYRSGADSERIDYVVNEILDWVTDGCTTKKIYSKAFALLKRKNLQNALRYRLKQALFEMGPTGYPFEQLVGEIFKRKGYQVEVGVIVEGRCVNHEMDLIATLEKTQILGECKYSKDQGKHVSVQVPLYVKSRIDDVIKSRENDRKYEGFNFYGLIATNTRFTTDSIKYANCVGLEVLSWDYPKGNGIKDLLEREKVFPITILQNLNKKQKSEILEKQIVTCSQLINNKNVIEDLQLSSSKQKKLMFELSTICESI